MGGTTAEVRVSTRRADQRWLTHIEGASNVGEAPLGAGQTEGQSQVWTGSLLCMRSV